MNDESPTPTSPEAEPEGVDPSPPLVILEAASLEVGLLCPNCRYSLRGLPEDRCPECGRAFDRQRLFYWTTGRDVPLLCDPGGDGTLPTESVFTASLLWPGRLGRNLPPFANYRASLQYARGVRVCAIALTASVGVSIEPRFETLIVAALAAIGVITGSVFTEVMLAAVFAHLVQPVAVDREATYAFWLVLCRCFSTHLLVSGAAVVVGFLIEMTTRGYGWMNLPTMLIGSAILWWWVCLGRAVLARGQPSAGRIAALLFVPVIAIMAIILGFFVALFCAWVVAWVGGW